MKENEGMRTKERERKMRRKEKFGMKEKER